MRIINPRTDFVIVEDYFTPEQAAKWLDWVIAKGKDPLRGFHHPDLKPNRFHKKPKYPVKKYMCLGLYWNPMEYSYAQIDKVRASKPFPIPEKLKKLCDDILESYYSYKNYSPQSVLVNFYTQDSSMGLHVDKDEEDHESPVIGINFGSTCRFFFEDEAGNLKDIKIPGNSVYIFGKSARLMKHGVGSLYAKTLSPGSESFFNNKERLNLTIRQVFA